MDAEAAVLPTLPEQTHRADAPRHKGPLQMRAVQMYREPIPDVPDAHAAPTAATNAVAAVTAAVTPAP